MSKIIRMKKSVFDQLHPDLTVEQAVNKTSLRLTETLLHESQPLYQKLLQSFSEEEIRSRRIRFDASGFRKADGDIQREIVVSSGGDDGCKGQTDCRERCADSADAEKHRLLLLRARLLPPM